jgi:hypothetical protein
MYREAVDRVDFEDLLRRHRERVALAEPLAAPYSEGDPLGDHRAFRVSEAESLAGRGLARFLGLERNTWKYTLRGALVATAVAFGRQLREMAPRLGRRLMSRPGPAGDIPSRPRAETGAGEEGDPATWARGDS